MCALTELVGGCGGHGGGGTEIRTGSPGEGLGLAETEPAPLGPELTAQQDDTEQHQSHQVHGAQHPATHAHVPVVNKPTVYSATIYIYLLYREREVIPAGETLKRKWNKSENDEEIGDKSAAMRYRALKTTPKKTTPRQRKLSYVRFLIAALFFPVYSSFPLLPLPFQALPELPYCRVYIIPSTAPSCD